MPDAEVIRQRDRERLLEILTHPVEASEADLALAGELLSRRDAIEIAAALVQAHRKAMPEPEELIDISTREGKPERGKEHHREGFDDIVWFRMDIGRRQNADPRWILPLLCRRGHITRNEVGAIRIAANETWFQIPRTLEARFVAAVKRTAREDAGDESGVTIELAAEPPRDTARRNARQQRGGPNDGPNDRPRPNGPRGNHGAAKPHRPGGPGSEKRPHRKGKPAQAR